MTTDWLLLQEAALWPSKGAVAAADDARHQLALGVGIADALLVDDCLSTCREPRPQCIEVFLDVSNLFHSDGRTGISLFTTTAVTALDVAAEVFRQDVRVQDDIAHLDEITKRLVAAHAA